MMTRCALVLSPSRQTRRSTGGAGSHFLDRKLQWGSAAQLSRQTPADFALATQGRRATFDDPDARVQI